MEAQKVDMFLMANAKFFPDSQKFALRERLLKIDDEKAYMLTATSFKDPTTAIILQIFGFGEFYIGNIGIGIAQWLVSMVTCGFGAIWGFIDIFLIGEKTKEYNFNQFNMALATMGV